MVLKTGDLPFELSIGPFSRWDPPFQPVKPHVEHIVLAARMKGDAVMVFVHAQVDGAVVATLGHLHSENVRGEAFPGGHVADADAEIRELRDAHGPLPRAVDGVTIANAIPAVNVRIARAGASEARQRRRIGWGNSVSGSR